MGLFNWGKNKKKKKQETLNGIKPKPSYDLYNNGETQSIKTQNSILVAYDENKIEQQTSPNVLKFNHLKDNGKKDMKKENKSTGRNIYYVSARKDKDGKKIGWEVKKEKAIKITKLCATKEEAVMLVKELAGNRGSTCIIRKMDGSIQETIKFDKE